MKIELGKHYVFNNGCDVDIKEHYIEFLGFDKVKYYFQGEVNGDKNMDMLIDSNMDVYTMCNNTAMYIDAKGLYCIRLNKLELTFNNKEYTQELYKTLNDVIHEIKPLSTMAIKCSKYGALHSEESYANAIIKKYSRSITVEGKGELIDTDKMGIETISAMKTIAYKSPMRNILVELNYTKNSYAIFLDQDIFFEFDNRSDMKKVLTFLNIQSYE